MGVIDKVSIYDTDRNGEKHHVLSSSSIEEAEWAFDELRGKIRKYRDAKIEWQSTFFDDEEAIGEVIR